MTDSVSPTTVLDAAREANEDRRRIVVQNQGFTAGSPTGFAQDVITALGIDPSMSVERLRADLEIAARARARLQQALDEGGDGDAVRVCSEVLGETP